MAKAAGWEAPSAAVAALIRATAERFLENPQALFDAVDASVLQTAGETLASEPALVAAMRQSNHANLLRWGRANVRAPGEPVPPNVSDDTLDLSRDVVRRGLDDPMQAGYRVGQNVAWRRWMTAAFELSTDVATLQEALDVSARSIEAFVEGTVSGIREQIDRERDGLQRGVVAQRLEVVSLILEGAPIRAELASRRLSYELARRHTACIVWTDAGAAGQGELERAAEELGRAAGTRRPLTVTATSSSLWAWLASADADPDLEALRGADLGPGSARAAIGPTAAGIDGFRRSHIGALEVQRLMQRMPAATRLAGHRDVQLVAMATHDAEETTDFVARTLGELATAGPELRDTMRAYIRAGCSATRCAQVMYAHRNTILSRLGRARDLLPAPLEGNVLEVGLALEIVHWLGARG